MAGKKRIAATLPPAGEYVREGDGARMIEVEPGWYVNAEVWAKLQRAGYMHCSKQEEA